MSNDNTLRTCTYKPLSFRIDCVPPTATAQQKGAFVCGGRVRFFTKRKVRESENFLAALISMHSPDVPFPIPVSVTVRWTFPWRKSERRRIVAANIPIPHVSRPDLDNLEKNLLDVLTRLNFWTDDSLVSEKRTSKWWGPKPGIDIRICPMDHGTKN